MAQYLEQYRASIEKLLYEPGFINDYLSKAEAKLGVKRIYLVSGIVGLMSLYLVFGYGAQLLCNVIGFVYPAYASVKAIESNSKDDDTKWLTYWVVFAYLSTLEFFSDILLSWFPFYWLAKCLLLVWCFAPVSWNGSTTIYNRVVRPAFLKHQSKLDAALGKAAEEAGRFASKAANQASKLAAEAMTKND